MTKRFTTPLPDFAVLRLTGDDAMTFLQGQLSCDIRLVRPEKGVLGCYCNLKGRIIALMGVLACEQGYELIMPVSIAEIFMEKMKPFVAFSKSTLIKTDRTACGYVGPAPESVHIPIGEGEAIGFYSCEESDATDQSNAFFVEMIQHRIPMITADNTELFLPHYINLVHLNAVSFKKGCFVGQEILARMQYKANIKKQAVAGYIDEAVNLKLGAAVTSEDKTVGEVVNSVIADGKTWVLCSVSGDISECVVMGRLLIRHSG